MLEGITEEGCDPVPELLVIPPPPPRNLLPDPESLISAPEKPDRPSSVDLNEYTHSPHLEDNGKATIVTQKSCETTPEQPP